jgi:hypothetical protein
LRLNGKVSRVASGTYFFKGCPAGCSRKADITPSAEKLLGITARELVGWEESKDERFKKVFMGIEGSDIHCKVKVQREMCNSDVRVKFSVVSLNKKKHNISQY